MSVKVILKITATIVLVVSLNIKGACQFINTSSGNILVNRVFITFGAEPGFVATVGYVHSVGQKENAINFQLGGSVKFAPLILANGAWRANFLTVADWKLNDKWTNTTVTNIYTAHDCNREGIFNSIGFEVRTSPLFGGKRWTKGFDFGWQYTPFTHIKHSAEAKETFEERYPNGTAGINGPKDGWYSDTASRLRIGFIGATSIGKNSAVQISVGSLINIQKQGILLGFSHAQVPAYVELGYNYQW